MRWLNYQHLYYFWHVARSGSVTLASQQLRLAQPTVSSQLKSLEEILGEKLLQKQGRHLKLTEAGLIAYKYAERIFNTGQELLDVLDGKSHGAIKELKIGISDVVPKSLAYKLIEPLFDSSLNVTTHCYEDKTERLLAELSIAEVDMVIADRPIPPNIKVKAFNHFVGECGVSFIATRQLAKKYSKNFPKSLAEAPLLLPTVESVVASELSLWFSQNEITPHCIAMFQDRALMKLAAKRGKGIMPIPTVVEEEVKKEFQMELVGRAPLIKEQLFLITTERRLNNPLLAKICSQAQAKLFSKHR